MRQATKSQRTAHSLSQGDLGRESAVFDRHGQMFLKARATVAIAAGLACKISAAVEETTGKYVLKVAPITSAGESHLCVGFAPVAVLQNEYFWLARGPYIGGDTGELGVACEADAFASSPPVYISANGKITETKNAADKASVGFAYKARTAETHLPLYFDIQPPHT